jgi:hypothetical protein
MAGCPVKKSSISVGKILSPILMITSLTRPTIRPYPSSCSTNWSLIANYISSYCVSILNKHFEVNYTKLFMFTLFEALRRVASCKYKSSGVSAASVIRIDLIHTASARIHRIHETMVTKIHRDTGTYP